MTGKYYSYQILGGRTVNTTGLEFGRAGDHGCAPTTAYPGPYIIVAQPCGISLWDDVSPNSLEA